MSLATLCRASRSGIGAFRVAHTAGRGLRAALVRAMAAAAASHSYFLLKYNYVPDILEKRGPYRADHLAGADKMAQQSKLMVAGALAEPVDGAVFIFRNASKEEVEAFVQADPYVVNGLVTAWNIRPYMVVAGDSK